MGNNNKNSLSKNFSIEPIEKDDIDPVIEMCVKLFSEAVKIPYSPDFFWFCTDFSISKKAVLNDEIIGCYLFNKDHINTYQMDRLEDLEPYKNKKCLQGVALGILKEYRGLSYGRQLRDSALLMNEYDFIWGFQVKTLNNLDNWLRFGRRKVGEIEGAHVTLMDMHWKDRITA